MRERAKKQLSPFGERLAALMGRAGFATRAAFMRAIRISPMSLARYETGERVPPAETLVAMSDALGCSVDELLGRAGAHASPEIDVIRALSALDRAAWLRVRAWADSFYGDVE